MGHAARSTALRVPPDPAAVTAPAPTDAQQAIIDALHGPGSIWGRFARAAKVAQQQAATADLAKPPAAPDIGSAAASAAFAAGIAATKQRRRSAGLTDLGQPAPSPFSTAALLRPRTLTGY